MEQSKMLVNQRFTEVLKLLNNNGLVESNKEFCEKLNIHVQIIYDIKNNKRSVTLDMLSYLLNLYNVNPSYILNNKGDVFLSGNLSGSMSGSGDNQNKTPQNNPSIPDNSQIQSQGSSKSFKSYPKPAKESKNIPLIGIEAMAGIGKGEFSVLEQDLTYYNIPELSRANFIIKVSGSSMYPKYSSGDLLACIYVSDTTFIQFGKVYVMDTGQGAVVKRLFKSQQPNHYLCQSDNPEYPSFDISLESIRALALVIGVIRFE